MPEPVGLLWEMNKAQSLPWNINVACRRFQAKFGCRPEVVELHPSVELDVEVNGLLVVRSKYTQPGHIRVRMATDDESEMEQCQIDFGKPWSGSMLDAYAGNVSGQVVLQQRML
jgi:hypothetical protein